MTNVYTYVEEITGLHEPELVELWAESWRNNGWNPMILKRSDAESSSLFRGYFNSISKLPTSNPRAYEDACYLRHLAMLNVGGGIMTDFDVINYGFTDSYFDKTPYPVLYTPNIPCVISGDETAFSRVCLMMALASADDFPKHCSDMYVVEKNFNEFGIKMAENNTDYLCVQYQDKGWETAPLVHFSSSSCNRPKRDKIIAARNPR